MNSICTQLCSRLTLNNIANFMFIIINGPSISIWNREDYVKRWLVKHRCDEYIRFKKSKNNIDKTCTAYTKLIGGPDGATTRGPFIVTPEFVIIFD